MNARLAGADVAGEHAVLVRHWAAVQARVSRQACEQARRCDELEAALLRLRARWVVATTQMLWGLGWPGTGATADRACEPGVAADEGDWDAAAAMCQTGCAGHAHPWRDACGACRLTGLDCVPVPLVPLNAIDSRAITIDTAPS